MNVDDKELARFVGKAIASRRVQAGLTQEEVAEVLRSIHLGYKRRSCF